MRRKHPKQWYRDMKAALRERDGDDCWICRSPTTGGDRTLDHWMPVSLGGGDKLENLKLAHAACNRRRGNQMPHRPLLDIEQRKILAEQAA